MSEFRTLLEEEERHFELPPGGFDRLMRRRDRKRRTKQIGALVFTLVLLAVLVGGAVSVFRSAERGLPANPSESPPPPRGEPVRPQTLDRRFDVATAWGEMDGVRWAIWTNDALSCLAFTSEGSGDYGGMDASCGNGYDGSDLKLAGVCAYACPDPERPIIYGTASGRVARVQLVLDEGRTYAGKIHASPPEVTVDARVFTVPTDRRWGTFTGMLTATAADGTVLGQIRYPRGADGAGGPSMPVSVEAVLASGVQVSAVDGQPFEEGRWEIAIWRSPSGDWCLGTIYPDFQSAQVATEVPGCVPRDALFQGIRREHIGHADIWWTDEGPDFPYRVFGTVSDQVDSVRLELGDGQVVHAELYDAPSGFEDMGRLFVAEFRSKDHPWQLGGNGGITWRAIALDANGEVLGSDEISM